MARASSAGEECYQDPWLSGLLTARGKMWVRKKMTTLDFLGARNAALLGRVKNRIGAPSHKWVWGLAKATPDSALRLGQGGHASARWATLSAALPTMEARSARPANLNFSNPLPTYPLTYLPIHDAKALNNIHQRTVQTIARRVLP